VLPGRSSRRNRAGRPRQRSARVGLDRASRRPSGRILPTGHLSSSSSGGRCCRFRRSNRFPAEDNSRDSFLLPRRRSGSGRSCGFLCRVGGLQVEHAKYLLTTAGLLPLSTPPAPQLLLRRWGGGLVAPGGFLVFRQVLQDSLREFAGGVVQLAVERALVHLSFVTLVKHAPQGGELLDRRRVSPLLEHELGYAQMLAATVPRAGLFCS